MRYQVLAPDSRWPKWQLLDTQTGKVLLSADIDFPDAEYHVRSQALFMNESPVKAALLPGLIKRLREAEAEREELRKVLRAQCVSVTNERIATLEEAAQIISKEKEELLDDYDLQGQRIRTLEEAALEVKQRCENGNVTRVWVVKRLAAALEKSK